MAESLALTPTAVESQLLSASAVNVGFSAICKLIGEAQRNGIIGAEEAANPAGVPNLAPKGTRLGNWLTREEAKKLLTVPDRYKIKRKQDHVILPLLLCCALRRQQLASLDVDGIQMREGWVLPVASRIIWRRVSELFWRNAWRARGKPNTHVASRKVGIGKRLNQRKKGRDL
jgi:integrase